MGVLEVFFWYCKEQKIMDIIFKMYYLKKLGTWKYDLQTGAYFEPLSLREFLTNRVLSFGFTDVFWDITPAFSPLSSNERYKTARSKWNKFVKNNIRFSDDFIKIGDNIEAYDNLGGTYSGTIIEFPKTFDGSFKLLCNGEEKKNSIYGCKKIIVNGEEKKPTFHIKRRKKIYGTNKG